MAAAGMAGTVGAVADNSLQITAKTARRASGWPLAGAAIRRTQSDGCGSAGPATRAGVWLLICCRSSHVIYLHSIKRCVSRILAFARVVPTKLNRTHPLPNPPPSRGRACVRTPFVLPPPRWGRVGVGVMRAGASTWSKTALRPRGGIEIAGGGSGAGFIGSCMRPVQTSGTNHSWRLLSVGSGYGVLQQPLLRSRQ